MARATPQSLTWNERALLAETQPDHLRTLDEDALLELLGRVRRARDRLVQLHRREVAGQVAEKVSAPRARGKEPIERKATAASRASNARRQAKRDAR